MRVFLIALLLVGCGSTVVSMGSAGGAGHDEGVAGAVELAGGAGSTAGSGGAAAGSPQVDAGAGGVEESEAGAAGVSISEAGAGGVEEPGGAGVGGMGGASGSAAGSAGSGGSTAGTGGTGGTGGTPSTGPEPGTLWSSCTYPPTLPLDCAEELTCGQYLAREGGQPGYVCTFLCWSMQTGPNHIPKMAPDSALTAQCTAAGGVCYAASSGYYPTCVPGLPK